MEDIIIETTIDDINSKKIYNIVESISNRLPSIKKLRSNAVRKHLLEDYGEIAFLDPINLKYPIIDPDNPLDENENLQFDCNLLLGSYCNLIKTTENRHLLTKAKTLLDENICPSIKIHLESLEEIIDLDTILFYFE